MRTRLALLLLTAAALLGAVGSPAAGQVAPPGPADLPPAPAGAAAVPAPPPEAPPPALTGAAEVSAGYYHSCARLGNGQVRCWGYNGEGELGNGDTTDTNLAVTTQNAGMTGPLTGITQVSVGIYHTCALRADRQVRCWGEGDYGAVGDGATGDNLLPAAVRNPSGPGNLGDVIQVSAGGYHTCAVLTNRQVRCWGYNQFGALGDGTTDQRNRPVTVKNRTGTGPLLDVRSVSAGYYGTCATLMNGEARCWGAGVYGQMGNGSTNESNPLPRTVQNASGSGPLQGVAEVDAGFEFSCALLRGGQVRCWGDGDYGQMGNDDVSDHLLPVTVRNVPGTGPLTTVAQLEVGDYLACVRLDNGQVRCWGDGEYGAMGNGDLTVINDRPVVVTNPADTAPLGGARHLGANDYSACAVVGGGQVRCWGYGEYGNIGNGANDYNTPLTSVVREA